MNDPLSNGAAALEEIRHDPERYPVCLAAAHAITLVRQREITKGLHWKEETADQIVTSWVTVRYADPAERKNNWRLLLKAATVLSHEN